MKYGEYITRLGFTPEELEILSDIDEKCRTDYAEDLLNAYVEYDKGDEAFGEYLLRFAEKSGIHVNTLNLYLYLRFLENTYKEYEKHGISEDIFIDTMSGFSVVSRLSLDKDGVLGLLQSIHRPWFRRELGCRIYTLGSLSFELLEAPCNMEIGGKSMKKGEMCISVHIPRSVRFDENSCEASYAQAREFFKKFYDMDNIIFMCHSWMLYPWLCEVLPETSAIVNFQKKFKIIQVDENEAGVGWIFSTGTGFLNKDEPIENYPEDTSLRRAAKQRLLEGKKLGAGLGIRL